MEVKQISTDKSTINLGDGMNLRHTYITVRSLVIRTDKLDNISHIIKVLDPIFGEERGVLLTVPHRPPLCLRCKLTGHIRAECATPYCLGCKRFGHTEPWCTHKGSYTSAAGAAVADPADNADMDEELINLADKAKEEGMEVDATCDPVPEEKIARAAKPSEGEGAEKIQEETSGVPPFSSDIKLTEEKVSGADNVANRGPSGSDQPTTFWADRMEVTSKGTEGWKVRSGAQKWRKRKEKRQLSPSMSAFSLMRRGNRSDCGLAFPLEQRTFIQSLFANPSHSHI